MREFKPTTTELNTTDEEAGIYLHIRDEPQLKSELNVSVAARTFKNLKKAGLSPSWHGKLIYIPKSNGMKEIISQIPLEIISPLKIGWNKLRSLQKDLQPRPRFFSEDSLENSFIDSAQLLSTIAYSTNKKFGAFELIGYEFENPAVSNHPGSYLLDYSGAFFNHYSCRKLTKSILEQTLEKVCLERGILIQDAFKNDEKVKEARIKSAELANDNSDIWEMAMYELYLSIKDIPPYADEQALSETMKDTEVIFHQKDSWTREQFLDYDRACIQRCLEYDLEELGGNYTFGVREFQFKFLLDNPFFLGWVPYGEREKVLHEMYEEVEEYVKEIYDGEYTYDAPDDDYSDYGYYDDFADNDDYTPY